MSQYTIYHKLELPGKKSAILNAIGIYVVYYILSLTHIDNYILNIILIVSFFFAGLAGYEHSINRQIAFFKGATCAIIAAISCGLLSNIYENIVIKSGTPSQILQYISKNRSELEDELLSMILMSGLIGGVTAAIFWRKAPELFFHQGNISMQYKNYSEAIRSYDKAIERNFTFAEAYYQKGVAELQLNFTEAARNDLIKAGEFGLNDAYELLKEINISH